VAELPSASQVICVDDFTCGLVAALIIALNVKLLSDLLLG
jgi:hypothetical protein